MNGSRATDLFWPWLFGVAVLVVCVCTAAAIGAFGASAAEPPAKRGRCEFESPVIALACTSETCVACWQLGNGSRCKSFNTNECRR